MIAQISPGELKGVFNSLEFAKDLVREWLPEYKFKNWNKTETDKKHVTDKMKTDRAKEIAKNLVDHSKWRSHGRSLKIEDLDEIGIRIIKIDKDIELSNIVYRIQTIIRLLFASSSAYKIFVTEKDKIIEHAIDKTPISSGTNRIPIKKIPVVEFPINCPQCGKIHNLYAKLEADIRIDNEEKKKGFKPYPKDNNLKCTCEFEIDLSGIRNEIERQAGKKIII